MIFKNIMNTQIFHCIFNYSILIIFAFLYSFSPPWNFKLLSFHLEWSAQITSLSSLN